MLHSNTGYSMLNILYIPPQKIDFWQVYFQIHLSDLLPSGVVK